MQALFLFREQDDFAPVVCIACNNCGSHSFRMDRQLKIFSTEIKYLHPMATSQLFQEVRVATQLEPMFGRVPATMVQRSNSWENLAINFLWRLFKSCLTRRQFMFIMVCVRTRTESKCEQQNLKFCMEQIQTLFCKNQPCKITSALNRLD